MWNTYQQAAEKLGITVAAVKKSVYRRRIAIRNMGHRTKLISDQEIFRVQQRSERKAIA